MQFCTIVDHVTRMLGWKISIALIIIVVLALVIGVIFFALWLTRKIERAWEKRKEKKTKTKANVFDLLRNEKADLAESISNSSEKLRSATICEGESIEKQKKLLQEEREILAERRELKRRADRLPRKKSLIDKNKYVILLGIFGTYLVIMCLLFKN
jgi:FtsZ-interacting cell division protein ZipA